MSSRTVWKYILTTNVFGRGIIKTPPGTIVHVEPERQDLILRLWIEVDPSAALDERTFQVLGTGHEIPEGYVWRHTWVEPPFVWHLYEVVPLA